MPLEVGVGVVGVPLLAWVVGLEVGLGLGDRRGLPGREGAGLRRRGSCVALR